MNRIETGIQSTNNPLHAELIIHTARIQVFQAVAGNGDMNKALRYYDAHRDTIIPTSVTIWARRPGIDRDPEQEIAQEVVRRFIGDIQVAKNYEQGVKIDDETYYLDGLIKETEGEIKKIKKSLKNHM